MNFLKSFLFISLLLITIKTNAQKVGVVLSGGGADALAHVGVLKALEENQIPIDYITGTSMGALVGALYASGKTPEEIEAYVTSPLFENIARGIIENDDIYYYQQIAEDAGLVRLKFSRDSILRPQLPTNLIDPISIDFELSQALSPSIAAANKNFDSLMVPFRCIAADIRLKQEVTFSKGSLSDAVRASMSYPFYLKPIYINGALLFDGGLYNNFPSDVMCETFSPDFIIGSSVSSTLEPPNAEDPFSQIKNMMVSKTVYSIDCVESVIINPKNDFGTFSFDKAEDAVDSGYVATYRAIANIKSKISRRISANELMHKREMFLKRIIPLQYDTIQLYGLSENQKKYVYKTVGTVSPQELRDSISIRRSYYKLYGDSKIKGIYPSIQPQTDSTYSLKLNIQRERDLILSVGGNLSTNPINHVFFSAQYNQLKKQGITLYTNGYYGRLYAGAKALARFDFPGRLPIYIQPSFTLQRWNYYRSRNFFFEEFKPSYLIQNEQFGSLKIGAPITNKGKIELSGTAFHLFDDYYQTQNFTQKDTVDETIFDGFSAKIEYENNTLNDRQFATSGARFSVSARYVNGHEYHFPGSTSSKENKTTNHKEWFQFKLTYQNYYIQTRLLKLGVDLQGVLSTQPLFSNYTSTLLRSNAFQPTPESKTLFLETFRTHQYAALGHKFIFSVSPQLHFRLEGYLFQPYEMIENGELNKAKMGNSWSRSYTILTTSTVWSSPIGPLSVSLNYYHNVPDVTLERTTPLTFLLNFGYILFNKKALD